MNKTTALRSPVVTLLSPSPIASKRAKELLQTLVGLEELPFSVNSDDHLNDAFRSSLPGFSRQWESVASFCPISGSIIHFCAIDNVKNKSGPLAMIGLTDSSDETPQESIQRFRDLLANHVKDFSTSIKFKESLGKAISPSSLLKSVSTGGLPLTQLPSAATNLESTKNDGVSGGLKEIVIPYFDYATFSDGSSFLSKLSDASLARPTVGVYRWTNSVTHIRPLPTAAEDHRLSPPSLIFQCSNVDDILRKTNLGLQVAKIGYSGFKTGQLMMLHPDLDGIDVRFCSQENVSSAFSEAQESLLAASLEELQSSNTLLAAGEEAKDDHRLGKADCWIEVRANLKQPSGYFNRTGGKLPSKPRIANIPDLPYE